MKKSALGTLSAIAALFLASCQPSVNLINESLNENLEQQNSRAITATADTEVSKRVTGYFCEWGIYGAHNNFYATSIPFEKLTHINYAFVGINPSTLGVEVYDPWASLEIVYPGEKWDTEYKGNLGMLSKLKKEHPGTKVLISVGGWTKSHGFHAAAATPSSRKTSAKNLVEFMKKYDLDGIDIDWEYPGINREKDPNDEFDKGAPGGIEDKENFTLFLKAIREELTSQGKKDGKYYELTVAVGTGYDKIETTNPGEYSKYVDAINLMSYDMHGAFESTIGHQAPLYANPYDKHSELINERYNIDWAVQKFLKLGVPSTKLVIGIPFYSRGWNNVSGGWDVDGNGTPDGMFGEGGSTLLGTWGVGGQSPYLEIKKLENKSGWEKFRDPYSKVAWLYNRSTKELYTYDDAESVKVKMDYIKSLNLGGAMYWEIDGDDWQNGYDLVNIIADAMLTGRDFGTDPNPPENPPVKDPVDSEPTNPTQPENPGNEPETTKATGVPGLPSVEQNKWNGDATFDLVMNMWWGNNGTKAELLENGKVIQTEYFKDNSPSAQRHTFTVTKKTNGTYQYQVRLTNKFGSSTSAVVKYTVSNASGSTQPPSDAEITPPVDDDNGENNKDDDSSNNNETPSNQGTSSYPAWKVNGVYAIGDIVYYNGNAYECTLSHTAVAESWTPDAVPALWKLLGPASGNENPSDPEKPEDPSDPVLPEPDPEPRPTPAPANLPRHILTGYWQNFNNGAKVLRINEVPVEYDIICVSFADATGTPGAVEFNLDTSLGFSEATFIKDIKEVQGRGQHVIISVGGQNGTISVNNDTSAKNFAQSITRLMNKYGFEGVDIDLENGVNAKYMEKALRMIPENSIITMAPETIGMQSTGAEYFKLALAIKDILTVNNTQYYNSGTMLGQDGKVYGQGNENFLTALAAIQLENGLAPSQVGLGLPASTKGAGSGYVDPQIIINALETLIQGKKHGSYVPPRVYKDFRGVMTWSINWDASNNWNFSKKVGAKLKELNSL